MTISVSPVIFDRQHALARMGGLEDLLRDVMELMLTESSKVHAQIVAAFNRRDLPALQLSAHTLKGSVSLVGASDLVSRLKHVEDCAASGQADVTAEDLAEIDRQFTELQRLMAAELKCSAV